MGNYEGFMNATGKDNPAKWWKAFLKTVKDWNADLSLWGQAEQLGVDYGTFIATPTLEEAGLREKIYVGTIVFWGNIYRGIVSSGAPNLVAPENCEVLSQLVCDIWTSPRKFIHPSYSREFAKSFSRNIVSPAAERHYFRRIHPWANW